MRTSKPGSIHPDLSVVVVPPRKTTERGVVVPSGAEPIDGVRSGGTTTPAPAVEAPSGGGFSAPDPEVSERPTRRRFTAKYKQRIVREADACTEPGAVGSLLRREGLYSSLLGTWRKQRDQRELRALAPQKRGRKTEPVNPLAKKLAQVEREKRDLERQLRKAHLLLDLQKKVSEILGISLEPKERDETE